MFDLIIHQAKVIDGTGRAAFVADIGIVGDRLAKVGYIDLKATAGRIIEAQNLVLTPGFVDIHGHSDYSLLIDPRAESKIRQGITLEVAGNCGYSAAPMADPVWQERKREYEAFKGFSLDWSTFPDYLEKVRASRPSLNYVFLVGYNTVRASSMGFADRPPSSTEVTSMEYYIEEALDSGAFGLSLGLVYAPGCFAQRDELIGPARLVAKRRGIITVHMRSEGKDLFKAIDEVLIIAREAQVSLQISHLKTYGQANWWKLDKALAMIESAREEGLEVTFDRYPYLAAQTTLQSLLPQWAQDGGSEVIVSRLRNKESRQTMSREMETEYSQGDFWSTVYISLVASEANKGLEGKNFTQLAHIQSRPPLEVALDLLILEKTQVEIILFAMNQENLVRILRHPLAMIGSDSSSRAIDGPLRTGKPHPRSFGTFPRVIQEFWREKKIISLEEAVQKMTYLPCQKLGLKDRGIIQEGVFADLVLFDPEEICDRATYQQPFQYPSGIKLVVVNGQIAVKEESFIPTGCGQILFKE